MPVTVKEDYSSLNSNISISLACPKPLMMPISYRIKLKFSSLALHTLSNLAISYLFKHVSRTPTPILTLSSLNGLLSYIQLGQHFSNPVLQWASQKQFRNNTLALAQAVSSAWNALFDHISKVPVFWEGPHQSPSLPRKQVIVSFPNSSRDYGSSPLSLYK